MIRMTKMEEGGWTAWIATGDTLSLEKLPDRLRSVLESTDLSDRVVSRLFPQAYQDDPEAESEYQHLLRKDLIKRKQDAIETFEKTLRASHKVDTEVGPILIVQLSDEDLAMWLGFLHDMRILLGTHLDIEDDDWHGNFSPEDSNADEWILLEWLSYLEEHILDALRQSEGLGGTISAGPDVEGEES